jgi:hypothetical protein
MQQIAAMSKRMFYETDGVRTRHFNPARADGFFSFIFLVPDWAQCAPTKKTPWLDSIRMSARSHVLPPRTMPKT